MDIPAVKFEDFDTTYYPKEKTKGNSEVYALIRAYTQVQQCDSQIKHLEQSKKRSKIHFDGAEEELLKVINNKDEKFLRYANVQGRFFRVSVTDGVLDIQELEPWEVIGVA
jgi:hypothetical protein